MCSVEVKNWEELTPDRIECIHINYSKGQSYNDPPVVNMYNGPGEQKLTIFGSGQVVFCRKEVDRPIWEDCMYCTISRDDALRIFAALISAMEESAHNFKIREYFLDMLPGEWSVLLLTDDGETISDGDSIHEEAVEYDGFSDLVRSVIPIKDLWVIDGNEKPNVS